MRSLRLRLLTALFLSVFIAWGLLTGLQTAQASRHITGTWDGNLLGVAEQILLCLPSNVGQSDVRGGHLSLPSNRVLVPQELSFQVWRRNPSRLLFRSIRAPALPFKADFRDGFETAAVAGESWRVYALSDATGNIQIQVGTPLEVLRAQVMSIGRDNLIAAAWILLPLAVAIWVVISWSLRPVTAIRNIISRRNPLDLALLPMTGLPAEMRPLMNSFNGLLAQLDAALQAERRFIAEAAHELRTPLAALLAQAQLAADASDDESRRVALATLVQGADRSTRLSEQLLDSARLDARKATDSMRLVAVHELVSLVVHDFGLVAQQRRQALSLHTQPVEILADTDDLGILLRNLIDNACRHAGEGARIRISCAEGRRAGAAGMCLLVADDGPGVAAEDRQRIFDRFYRAPGTTGRGSGIGLWLVARIVQLHRGTVEARAGIEGRGFGVSVWLPADPTG